MAVETQEVISSSVPFLSQFLEEEQTRFPNIPPAISTIIQAMSTAAGFMSNALIQAALDNEAGNIESFNASGDVQQRIDMLAQNFFLETLENTQEVCAVISEESDGLVPLAHKMAKYIVALDPLDGSSNVDVNGPVGTLFSIYQRTSSAEIPLQDKDGLILGKQQLAAGYILYSTVTMLVYATIYGVHGFTYNPTIDEFFLTHPAIRMPENGLTYAINHSYLHSFPHYVQNYITYCRRQELSSRYTGALVADFHRHLLEGGIYLYPPTYKRPNGKLRLMFECNVLAFIAEQAGGLASDGRQPILNIIPRHLHQCVPFYIGSKMMVQKLLSCVS
ncbi:MAG: fructose-bisphosphatase [Candidatus Amoebophilus sp. 36-38]|nr:MAG: fructose-bisphosphatase [Candidatus Amoebophilus sp. 36-38]